MRPQRLKWAFTGLFVLWVFFTLATFFAVQKPFSAANAGAMGRALLDLLAAGWLSLLALAVGAWLLERLLPVRPTPAESVVLGTGLGLGLLGLLSLALGLLGLFRPTVAYGVTLVLSVLLIRPAVRLFQEGRSWRLDDRPHWLITLYLAAMALFTLPVALLPPTDWDGLFYHLTGPSLYLQSGRISSGIDIPHLNFPALMEMLFAWSILLRGDVAAKLLHTVFGLLLAGLVYLTARRLLSRKSAWLAVAAFASMPMVSTLAGWAYNDLALAFYQLASVYAISNYQLVISKGFGGDVRRIEAEEEAFRGDRSSGGFQGLEVSWLVLSGVFAGLAMGLKYTSFVTPVVVGGLIGWFGYRRLRLGGGVFSRAGLARVASHLAVFSLAALLVALPWYLKNWAFTGNPVYPFLSGLFGGQFWDSFRADWYAAAGTGINFRPGTLLALPWLLTLGIRDANYWDGRTGPLFLLFLPLALLYGLFRYRRHEVDRPPALGPLLLFSLAQFGFWTLGVIWSRSLWQSRLLLPGLVGLAPVVGWLWADLSRFDLPHFSLSRFVNLAIGLTLALTLLDVGLLTLRIDPLPYLTGLESTDQYLARRLGAHYAAMEQINRELPPEAVILFLWEPRSYYCQRDCRPDSILDEFPHQVYQNGSAETIARTWREAGVSHLLIHRSGLRFVLNEAPETINEEVLSRLEACCLREEIKVGSSYQIYAVEEPQQAGP